MFNILLNRFINKTNNLKNRILGGDNIDKENFDFGYISSYLLFINTLLYIFYSMSKNNTSTNEIIYFVLSLTLSILFLHFDINNYIKKNKDLIILIGSVNSLLLIAPYFVNIIYIISKIQDTNQVFDGFIKSLINFISNI